MSANSVDSDSTINIYLHWCRQQQYSACRLNYGDKWSYANTCKHWSIRLDLPAMMHSLSHSYAHAHICTSTHAAGFRSVRLKFCMNAGMLSPCDSCCSCIAFGILGKPSPQGHSPAPRQGLTQSQKASNLAHLKDVWTALINISR